MSLEWNNRSTDVVQETLLTLDRRVLGLNDSGDVTLSATGEFELATALLASHVRFASDVPGNIQLQIVREAVVQSKRAKDLSATTVLDEMRKGQKEYKRNPTQEYTLLSTISLDNATRIGRRRVGDTTIRFSRVRPKALKLDSEVPNWFRYKREWWPSGYTFVRTTVMARDEVSAVDTALESLDMTRAIWNLGFLANLWIMHYGHPLLPLNKIVLGPVHTLHQLNGELASSGFWIESGQLEPITPKRVENYPRFSKFERAVRTWVQRAPPSLNVPRLLVRYTRALDERQMSDAFLKLWALLEELTATSRMTYDTTIQRAVFLKSNRKYHRNLLHFLRSWRNRIVHEGTHASEASLYVNQIKHYVEILLLFLLDSAKDFSTLDEFGTFLNSSTDESVVERRIAHQKRALRILMRQRDALELGK